MIQPKPKVSIGLPVYNGENFLAEAIESILCQSFEDFELVISDNASTDSTQKICEYYQAKDDRVKYSRNQENIGAARNYNRVFDLASGEYFKWAAHDDICHPDFLEKCVSVLDDNPSIVLAYTRCNRIDETGKELGGMEDFPKDFSSPRASKRVEWLISFASSWILIFGLIRSDILSKTPLLGSFPEDDWILLFELALHGSFREIPELLFSFREHSAHYTSAMWLSFDPSKTIGWFDPQKAGSITLPYWKRAYEHFVSCNRVALTPKERFICFTIIIRFMLTRKKSLAREIVYTLIYAQNQAVKGVRSQLLGHI